MRLMERLILWRLQKHLKDKNILIDSQSGFRKNRSTRDNLTFLIQKSRESFNRKRNVLAVFFDIEAAFDKVWHNGLIYKLVTIKVPYYLLRIIIEFLDKRRFCIRINNETSEWIPIECGVPQGAVLSPTLFSIYINDSPSRNSKNTEQTLLFADDTAYIQMFKNKNKMVTNRVDKYLNELSDWAKKWRVTLAPHKCQYIVITKGQEYDFDLILDGKRIEKVEEIKFLGLRIDKRMSFEFQVRHLRNACKERTNIVKVLRHKSWHLSEKIIKEVYHSLVRSILEYTAFIFNLLSDENKRKIEAIQNNVLRFIYWKKRQFGNKNLLELANEKNIETRLKELKENYILKGLLSQNPLISSTVEEYRAYSRSRELNTKTLLCDINWLDDSLFDGATE